MILSCQNLTYSYIDEKTLNGVAFHINKGEHTAIVGVNGAGKTTLFKILTGQLTPDEGNIFIAGSVTLGYLSQHAQLDSALNVFEEVYTANQKVLQLKARLEEYENQLANTDHPSEELLHNYHDTMEAFEDLQGFGYDSLVKGVLKGLGFTDSQFNQSVTSLSGGQKTRLALAKLLIIRPDLLLLDEPTNHLDLKAITWLENYLSAYKGTLIIVSHDRYFLDKIVSKVVDLEYGKSKIYKGNYSSFIKKKEFNTEVNKKHYQQQQSEIKRQEEIISRLRSFRDEKFIKRAVSREKALAKMDIIDRPMELNTSMNLNLDPKRESGKDVLHIEDLSMAFDETHLFSNLNLDIYKGDKVALIGDNGTGKTTLFKLLMGQLRAKTGFIKIGTNVEIAYYDQEHASLTGNSTLIEEINDEFPTMEISKIRNLLASFLFVGDDVFKEVSSLSGGEKGRLALAKLMLSKGNFLLLDEPTNHLDMISKEVLENALNHYSGTILFISHDRYFINKTATKVMELTPDGTILYDGNYDYYVEKKEQLTDNTTQSVKATSKNKLDWKAQKEADKLKRQLQNKIDALEKNIEQYENKIKFIDGELAKEEIFMSYEKSSKLMAEKEEVELALATAYEEWDTLQE